MSLAALVSVIVVIRLNGDGEVWRFGGKKQLIMSTVFELLLRVAAITLPWVVATEVWQRKDDLHQSAAAAVTELGYSVVLWTLSVLATKWYILLLHRAQFLRYNRLIHGLLAVSGLLRVVIMTETGRSYGQKLWAPGLEERTLGDHQNLLPIWVWYCWAATLCILFGGMSFGILGICRLRSTDDINFHALCETGPVLMALATNVIASSNGGWWVPEAHLYSVDDPIIADALLEISTSVERQLALIRDVQRRSNDISLLRVLVLNQIFDVLGVILLENWFCIPALGRSRWSTTYFDRVTAYECAIIYMFIFIIHWLCFRGPAERAEDMCRQYDNALKNVQRARRTVQRSRQERVSARPLIPGRHIDPPLRVIKPVFGFQSGLWASGPVSEAFSGRFKKDMDPVDLYNLSSPADRVEFFVSHCWRNDGFHKASKIIHYLFAQQFLAVIWVIWVLPAILLLALGAAGISWMLYCGLGFLGLGVLCTLWVGIPLCLNALARYLNCLAKHREKSHLVAKETPPSRSTRNGNSKDDLQEFESKESHATSPSLDAYATWLRYLAELAIGAQATACRFAVWRWLGSGITLWLDKACIDQTSDETKAAGIDQLDKYLMQSKRMLVLLSTEYLSRMWCVFELALFLKWRGVDSCQFLGLEWPAWYSPSVWMGSAKSLLSAAEEDLLSNFSCEKARCYDPRDYARLIERIRELWGSTDKFDHFVRTRLKDAVIIGKQRYYTKFQIFAKQVLNKAAIGL